MTAKVKDSPIDRQSMVHVIIGILVFGSIWGFLEATLGGFLHLIIFPKAEFIAADGATQAAFWGIFLPLGYLVGEKLALTTFPMVTRRVPLYYAGSAVVVVFCWAVSAIAIMAGL